MMKTTHFLNEEGISVNEFNRRMNLAFSAESRHIPSSTKYLLFKIYNFKCSKCSKKIQMKKNKNFGYEEGHIDHIHPFSKWQSYKGDNIHEPKNLIPLCRTCNLKKKDKVEK